MFRASAGSRNTDPETFEKKGLIHICCESLQIGVPLVLSRGPNLEFEALQWWSKFGVHKTRLNTTPNRTYELH